MHVLSATFMEKMQHSKDKSATFTGNWLINSIWISFLAVSFAFSVISVMLKIKSMLYGCDGIDRKTYCAFSHGTKQNEKKNTQSAQMLFILSHFWLWKVNIFNVYDYSRAQTHKCHVTSICALKCCCSFDDKFLLIALCWYYLFTQNYCEP